MQIDAEIREVSDNKQYCSKQHLFIGKLNVATYGWDYGGSKDDPRKYEAHSDIHFIKRDKWKFETIEEARACACKIAEAVIKGLSYKKE